MLGSAYDATVMKTTSSRAVMCLLITGILLLRCDHPRAPKSVVGTPFGFHVVDGGAQCIAERQTYAKPLVLQMVDQFGTPVPGSSVAVAASNGIISGAGNAQLLITDSNGLLSIFIIAGAVPEGQYEATVSVTVNGGVGVSLTTEFTTTKASQLLPLTDTSNVAASCSTTQYSMPVRAVRACSQPFPGVSLRMTRGSCCCGATSRTWDAVTDVTGTQEFHDSHGFCSTDIQARYTISDPDGTVPNSVVFTWEAPP